MPRTAGTGHLLTRIDGDGMSADDAAWAMLADSAERALMLPGLSRAGLRLIAEAADSCRLAAGLAPVELELARPGRRLAAVPALANQGGD